MIKQFSIQDTEKVETYQTLSESPVVSVAVTSSATEPQSDGSPKSDSSIQKFLFTGDESGFLVQWSCKD
jgi:hypothetical protein